ncbi:MAG: heparinase II/III family protein [Lentisphaerae bacterium]|nr:heparinase II/III family protein [Lentisphaerota bacterium]
MSFAFACAAALYRKGVHPRLLAGPEDLARLRRRIRAGAGLKIMTALRRKVRPLAESILQSDDLPAFFETAKRSHNEPAALLFYGLDDLALAAALDRNAEWIEALRRVLAAVILPENNAYHLSTTALAYDLLHAFLSPDERAAYGRAASAHVPRVIASAEGHFFKNAAGNGVLCNTLSALPLALAVRGDPGAPDLTALLQTLTRMYAASLFATTHPNGYPEEDIGYGTGVAAWLAIMGEMLRRAGLYDCYRDCPRFQRFGAAMLHFVQPWGEDLSNTGDHGDDFGMREFVLARQAAVTRNPVLKWLLGTLHYTHGKVHPENTLPDFYIEVPLRPGFRTPASALSLLVLDELKGEQSPAQRHTSTAYCDPGRGIVSFRSGWQVDDAFVVFDGSQRSPAGQGHAHDSCGHFSLSALGEYFAVDTGRYNIEQNCHNVVLIDGKSGRSTDGEWRMSYYHGLLRSYRPGAFCDSASVDSSHQHNCYWARRWLGLVKGPAAPAYVWTVEDINKNNAWAEYWWQLHTSPENTIALHHDYATITGWRHGHCLDVFQALPAPAEYPQAHTLVRAQDVATVSSYKYIPDIEVSVRRYRRPADMLHGPVYARGRLLVKVAGYNGRFLSVMIPRRKDRPPPTVERLTSLSNTLAVKIVFPKVEDTLIFAYEHNLLEAGSVRERAQWCVVRRRRDTGAVLVKELG